MYNKKLLHIQRNRKIGFSVKRKKINISRFQDDPDVEISTQDVRAALREKMVIMTTWMRKSQQRKQSYKKTQVKF